MDDYQEVFRKAAVGLGVADLQGNLLAVNGAMLEPGGYSREDLQEYGNVASLYADDEARDKVMERLRKAGRLSREEIRLLRRDGSAYDTLLSLVPVRFRGQRCVLATVEDLTALKEEVERRRALEAELWQAQKMSAVGEMTAGIAHDFNNVLAVILAHADLLEAGINPDDPDARQDLDELRAAAQNGAHLVRKLLGFSRKADIDPVPTDVGATLESMTRRIRSVLHDGVEVRLEVVESGVALCDSAALEQMVMNLVTNARDAMPAGGTVEVRVTEVTVDPEAEPLPEWMMKGDYVQVSVRDHGIGMDEETLQRALEPFFTTKPGASGTGLGLSMVYGLVKQHEGFVDLRSAPGEGTTASLYLPRG